MIENLYSQLVAFIYVNTTGAADPTAFVELTWAASSSDEVTTTTTTTTVETTTSGPPSQQLGTSLVLQQIFNLMKIERLLLIKAEEWEWV